MIDLFSIYYGCPIKLWKLCKLRTRNLWFGDWLYYSFISKYRQWLAYQFLNIANKISASSSYLAMPIIMDIVVELEKRPDTLPNFGIFSSWIASNLSALAAMFHTPHILCMPTTKYVARASYALIHKSIYIYIYIYIYLFIYKSIYIYIYIYLKTLFYFLFIILSLFAKYIESFW